MDHLLKFVLWLYMIFGMGETFSDPNYFYKIFICSCLFTWRVDRTKNDIHPIHLVIGLSFTIMIKTQKPDVLFAIQMKHCTFSLFLIIFYCNYFISNMNRNVRYYFICNILSAIYFSYDWFIFHYFFHSRRSVFYCPHSI